MRAISVGRTVDLFLAHVADSSKQTTWAWYGQFLGDFRRAHGTRSLAKLTPAMLDRWIADTYGSKTDSARHAAARVVCRLCNWAVSEGLIAASPLRNFRNCRQSSREIVLSGADYAALIRASDQPLRDVIKFLWHTGARPQEMRAIKSEWIGDRKIVLPMRTSKGEKRRRVIYLDGMATAIVARLAEKHPAGPIFRNRQGRAWEKAALCKAFDVSRTRAKVPGACAYVIRHTWITRMLERGIDVATVATLAGNSPGVVLKVYSHVADNEDRLRRIVG